MGYSMLNTIFSSRKGRCQISQRSYLWTLCILQLHCTTDVIGNNPCSEYV